LIVTEEGQKEGILPRPVRVIQKADRSWNSQDVGRHYTGLWV